MGCRVHASRYSLSFAALSNLFRMVGDERRWPAIHDRFHPTRIYPIYRRVRAVRAVRVVRAAFAAEGRKEFVANRWSYGELWYVHCLLVEGRWTDASGTTFDSKRGSIG